MEQLPALGTAIAVTAPKTMAIYAPLLVQNKESIKSTKRSTFPYGSNPRQALDVYYPSRADQQSAPILMFFYGGGLVRGDKTIPALADGLAYANLGHFFADKLSYVTVIADYRLMSHGAKFPSGGEDIAEAVEWVVQNLAPSSDGEQRDLFIMGNSAGGIHLSTFLFHPQFEETRAKVIPKDGKKKVPVRFKGGVLLSVPFHFRQAVPERAETLGAYFGDWEKNSPLGLFEAFAQQQGQKASLAYGVLVLNGTLDPEDEILIPKKDFVEAWQKSGIQSPLAVEMMEGQNHISPPLSLGTGRENEEVWGYQVGRWVDGLRKQDIRL